MSRSSDLADAIVARLNAGEFSRTFTAERRAAPLEFVELEQLADLRVSVFSGTKRVERLARRTLQATYLPVVAVQQKLTGTAATELEAVTQLETLVEEIEDHLADFNPTGFAFQSFNEEQAVELYGAEAMQQLKVFAAGITLQYGE